MRRLAVLGLLTALLLCACGTPRHEHRLWLTPGAAYQLVSYPEAPNSPAYAETLHWSGISIASGTGFYVYQGGTQIADVASSPYTFQGLECGTSYTLGIAAHDGSGNKTSIATVSYTTPNCAGGGVQVGAPTPAGVTCTTTLNAGANVQTAVSSAAPGDTVCLNSGSWSAITLSSIAPSSNVTLAATPGQTVNVPGFVVTGTTQNLTIEGFYLTSGAGDGYGNGIDILCQVNGGLTIQYNTIANLASTSAGYAIKSYAENCGSTDTQTGVSILYNQMDNASTFIEVQGNGCGCASSDTNWTISHNVMGPGENYGSAGHYIEGQWVGATIDNNAFEGPVVYNSGAHNNVLHCDTVNAPGCQNITFDNNIMWEADSRAQTVLITDNTLSGIQIENNLDVEDPTCETGSSCPSSPFFIDKATGVTLLHNTSANAPWSINFSQSGANPIASPGNYDVEDNIATGTPQSGQNNFGSWGCVTTPCTAANNVTQDNSATSVLPGGAGSVINWTPAWQTTTWTPTVGQPWNPPPAGYYQPITGGGVTSSMGWQGVPCTATVRTNCIGP